MTKNELKKMIREIVAMEIKAVEKELIIGVVAEVKGGLLKEIKAEMFDVLTSNRLPQPTPMVENSVIPTQPTATGRQDLRALFEQANPVDFTMGDAASVPRAPVVKSIADLPPTAEKINPASVALYEKLLSGGK